jgi:hypothetical protein
MWYLLALAKLIKKQQTKNSMKKPYKTEQQILIETKARIAAVDARYEAYMSTQRGTKAYNAALINLKTKL